jgi:hypothetical protein
LKMNGENLNGISSAFREKKNILNLLTMSYLFGLFFRNVVKKKKKKKKKKKNIFDSKKKKGLK